MVGSLLISSHSGTEREREESLYSEPRRRPPIPFPAHSLMRWVCLR